MTQEEELEFLETLNASHSLIITTWNPKKMSDETLNTIISRAMENLENEPVITEDLYKRLVLEHLGEGWSKKYLEIYPYSNPKPNDFICK